MLAMLLATIPTSTSGVPLFLVEKGDSNPLFPPPPQKKKEEIRVPVRFQEDYKGTHKVARGLQALKKETEGPTPGPSHHALDAVADLPFADEQSTLPHGLVTKNADLRCGQTSPGGPPKSL